MNIFSKDRFSQVVFLIYEKERGIAVIERKNMYNKRRFEKYTQIIASFNKGIHLGNQQKNYIPKIRRIFGMFH